VIVAVITPEEDLAKSRFSFSLAAMLLVTTVAAIGFSLIPPSFDSLNVVKRCEIIERKHLSRDQSPIKGLSESHGSYFDNYSFEISQDYKRIQEQLSDLTIETFEPSGWSFANNGTSNYAARWYTNKNSSETIYLTISQIPGESISQVLLVCRH
jgi:hypothetical protein